MELSTTTVCMIALSPVATEILSGTPGVAELRTALRSTSAVSCTTLMGGGGDGGAGGGTGGEGGVVGEVVGGVVDVIGGCVITAGE